MTKIDTSTEAIAAIIKAHDEGRPHDCKGFTALELAARDLVPALTAERDALRAEVERLRYEINEASDPNFIWGALYNVHDCDTTLDDYADAASRAIRAALKGADND